MPTPAMDLATPPVRITAHAASRFRERVADLPLADIRKRLDTPAVRAAIRIGAPYVRLPTRQRIVIVDGAVVTVLPSDCTISFVARYGR